MVSLYLSVKDAQAVANKDNVHANGKFVADNSLQVKVAVNSYLSMLLGDLCFTEG